jgi:xanthine dehydrogenase YagR molybdenum-binding subunit
MNQPPAPNRPTPRIDGAAKVTGSANYTADVALDGMVYAAVVQSGPARGRIASIDIGAATATPGVLKVWTYANMPRLRKASDFPLGAAWQQRLPLHEDRVQYSGEIVALVAADRFEAARAAAAAVRPVIRAESAAGVFARASATRMAKLGLRALLLSEDTHRGKIDAAFASAPLTIDQHYETPRQLHMAMEPHATVAWWDADGTLNVREGTQWVDGAQAVFAKWFGLSADLVRLHSTFVGGGFGLRLGLLPHAALAAMAARELKRPVKLVLDRAELCLLDGGRPATRQHVRLAARADGRLTGMVHDTANEAGRESVFNEPGSRASKSIYAVANYSATHSAAQLDIAPPSWMRAPGESPGSFAMESAMDELAVAAGLDPIELRLRNHADKEPASGKPWSTKHLREAYAVGAHVIGWHQRATQPRARQEGNEWIGIGMATAGYSAKAFPSEARLCMHADGRVALESRGTDIGTGAYTAMALIVADVLGIPIPQVDVRMGDTSGARSSWAGGSMMTASLGSAVHGAAHKMCDELMALARAVPGSPFQQDPHRELCVSGGRVAFADAPAISLPFDQILAAAGLPRLEAFRRTHPTLRSRIAGAKAFTTLAGFRGPKSGGRMVHSWGAQFAEVGVDVDTGMIRVRRMVGAFDCGRILNPTTARSQLLGGMVMGLGMALAEEVTVDARSARPVNHNLGEYLVPVHADIPEMQALFVGEFDSHGGPLGGKPVGEVGITGVAAAIANAVYNAVGTRLRKLPLQGQLV